MKEESEMTTEELEQLLKSRKEKERKAREKEKQAYEGERDNFIEEIIASAKNVNEMLESLKDNLHEKFDEQQKKLNEYGGIRSNSKGGFSLTHSNGEMRLVRRRDTIPQWDERAKKAESLIKEFLFDKVKKRDKVMFELLISFLEKNKDGDLEYSSVMNLLKHRDKFDDTRWLEGLRLLEESYSNVMRCYNYQVMVKDKKGKWVTVCLNFSSI